MLTVLVACLLAWPVGGPVVADFAPRGRVQGHWGIDIGVDAGTVVTAPVAGTVTFAGSVAGMQTVSIDDGGGVRVSVSYLADIAVKAGDHVAHGRSVGMSGVAHGVEALHLSVRIEGRYVDPLPFLVCGLDLARGLWLVEPSVRPR